MTPHEDTGDERTEGDASNRYRPKRRLDGAQETGSDAEYDDAALHRPEAAALDVDLHQLAGRARKASA